MDGVAGVTISVAAAVAVVDNSCPSLLR
jgi:hypothetical protein